MSNAFRTPVIGQHHPYYGGIPQSGNNVNTPNYYTPHSSSSTDSSVAQHQMQQSSKIWYMVGGFKNRYLLALESGLPNEIDWAFNELIKLSFFCPENFHIDVIPGILDVLLNFVDMNKLLDPSALVSPTELERFNQVFHIVRNFSFLEVNYKSLLLSTRLLSFLQKIFLAPYFKFPEIFINTLDIIENLSSHISIQSLQDPLFEKLKQSLFSDDRAILLGALRTLTKLCISQSNEPIFMDVDQKMIRRLFDLILIWDEDIVYTVMEFLYQYTSIYGDVSTDILKCLKFNGVGVLIKFLSWRSGKSGKKEGPIEASEVQVCIEWLKNQFSHAKDAMMVQSDVFSQYLKFCSDSARKTRPLSVLCLD
jgi:hypothetical protein